MIYPVFGPANGDLLDPTIGTAIYVSHYARGHYPKAVALHTLAGRIPFTYDGADVTASVDIPHNVRIHRQRVDHPLLSANPHSEPTVPLVSIVKGMTFILVPVASLEALGSFTQSVLPGGKSYERTHLLDTDDGFDVGLIGTFYYCPLGVEPVASGGGEVKLIRTRMLDGAEDPGTGSASAALCCYLSLSEGKEKGKGPFGYHLVQGVEMGRKCDIFVDVWRTEDGSAIQSVNLKGTAVKVMEGTVEIDAQGQ